MVDQRLAGAPIRRDRLIAALNHKEPDRVPIDIGSIGGGITNVAYYNLKDLLGIKGDEGTSLKANLTVEEFDERVLSALDVDIRHIGLRGPSRRTARVQQPDGSTVDEWGIVSRRVGHYNQIVGNPLRNASLNEIESYHGPDPNDPGRVQGLKERARRLTEETDFGLSAKSVSGGIFQMCCRLRGMEQFLMDMILNKPLAKALMSRVEQIVLDLETALLEEIGPYVQMAETQDDLGTQHAPMISPAMYREFIQPSHARLAALIKKKTGGVAKVFIHSDGSIFDMLPDVIDAGIEVLNPVQPQAAKMDAVALKEKFGDRLVFHGGLDQQHTIPHGTVADAEGEVRRVLRAFAKGGGYIFSPCHNLQPDVPPENILAIYRTAAEFGRYPIR